MFWGFICLHIYDLSTVFLEWELLQSLSTLCSSHVEFTIQLLVFFVSQWYCHGNSIINNIFSHITSLSYVYFIHNYLFLYSHALINSIKITCYTLNFCLEFCQILKNNIAQKGVLHTLWLIHVLFNMEISLHWHIVYINICMFNFVSQSII